MSKRVAWPFTTGVLGTQTPLQLPLLSPSAQHGACADDCTQRPSPNAVSDSTASLSGSQRSSRCSNSDQDSNHDEEAPCAKVAAMDWFAAHLGGDALGVLDLPAVDASELLPHQMNGVSRVEASCCSNEHGVMSCQREAGAHVVAALATVLHWLTRSDGSMVLGIEGNGPLLHGQTLETPVPIKVPFPTAGSAVPSPAALATEVGHLMRSAVEEHGPDIGSLPQLCTHIKAEIPEGGMHHGLFQVLVAFQGPDSRERPDRKPLTRYPKRGCQDAAPLAMVLVVRAGSPKEALKLRLAYSLKHVGRSFASSALGHLCRLLEKPLSDWWRPTEEMCLAGEDERHLLLNSWSLGATESLERFTQSDGGDLCVHELFECRRRGAPFAKAIISGEADTECATMLTYAAADAWASDVARQLREVGVGRGDVVALLFERCPAMVIAIYAVLKAGGCYCPCDVAWPADRLSSVLQGGKPRAALCPQKLQPQLRAAANDEPLPILCMDDGDAALWANSGPPASAAGASGHERPSSSDPCYVFFTSGSTGKPKGVVVEHRGLVHRVRWLQLEYQLRQGDAALLKHAYTFGLSEWEIFWPLSYGASVVTCTPGAERDPSYMVKLCQRHHVPVCVFVPSALQAFLESVEESKAAWQEKIAAMTRQIIACGEPLRPPMVHMAHRLLTKVRVDNVFGPTEGEMTRYACPKGRPMRAVPVGRPIDGSVVYVLGSAGQLCGTEVPGELHFAGPCIARGYFNEPGLTAEKFVPDPFVRDQRMYKTGDLVRWRSDGELVFVGRADHQVKIRGFRIELGDIEVALRAAGGEAVLEVVVLVDASKGTGSERLVAHVGVGAAADGAGARSLEKRLLVEAAKRLPPYMVPALAVLHAKLPRNANGKVDRRSLTVPDAPAEDIPLEEVDDEAVGDEAMSCTEKDVREVWAEVLKVPARKIPLEDSFFASLGGNSLLAGRVTAVLRRKFKIDLSGTAMYTHSTIKRLAQQVDLLRSQLQDQGEEATAEIVNHQPLEYAGFSSSSPKAMIFQFFGVILVDLAQDFGPQATVYCALGAAYYLYGLRWWLPLFMTAVSLGELLIVALSTAAIKWLVLGRLQPGSYPLWGSLHLRWWLVDRFFEDAHNLLGLLAETPLLTAWLRLVGAKIHEGARLNDPKILTPDLVEIGEGVDVRRNVTLGCAAVYGGMLHLDRVSLGAGCELDCGSYVAPGSIVPERTRLLPMATSPGKNGGLPGSIVPLGPRVRPAEEQAAARFWRQQGLLRMLVGLPWLGFLLATPYLGSILMLEHSWHVCKDALPKPTAWAVWFYIVVPVIITHAYALFLVVAVVLHKRLLVGRLCPGLNIGPPSSCSACSNAAWRRAHWDTLRHWLHERCVTSRAFEHALEPLVNSELLSCVHRLLGAEVGRRVQSDNFKAVEHDCIKIEDFTVFGSAVTMNCDAPCPGEPYRRELRSVCLLRASNCLDHSQVMPGVVVGEAAVLGTRTLAHQDACFPPDSISTGAISGRSVLLRTEASASAPPQDRAQELRVMKQLESPLHWSAFNFAQVSSAFVAYSLPQLAWVLATGAVLAAIEALETTPLFAQPAVVPVKSPLEPDHLRAEAASELSAAARVLIYWNVWLAAFLAVEVGLLLTTVVLKWLVMGRYREENHTFFSSFHYRWAIMLNVKGAMAPLADHLSGTVFQAWFYRLMGAKVGKNAYLAGIALEFDLLEVGDGAAINDDCDATAHTVERMVLKMAPVRAEANTAMLPGSVVMPGGLLEKGALLLERSQVLKGDVVREGEVWAGQPAQRIGGSVGHSA